MYGDVVYVHTGRQLLILLDYMKTNLTLGTKKITFLLRVYYLQNQRN